MSENEQAGAVAWGFPNTAVTGAGSPLMMVRLQVPSDDQYGGAFWIPLYPESALTALRERVDVLESREIDHLMRIAELEEEVKRLGGTVKTLTLLGGE